MITPERFKEIRSLFVDISDKLSEDELNAISDLLERSIDVIKIANTRPTPARCDELETWKFHSPVNGSAKMIQSDNGEWVPRSQAEAIIRDLETKILDTAISDRLDGAGSPLTWQERAEIAEELLAAKDKLIQSLIDFDSEEVKRLEADNEAKDREIERRTKSLIVEEQINAAKDARIKELDDECNELVAKSNEIIGQRDHALNLCAQMEEGKEALEADNKRLREALEKIADWPNGGNSYGQESIKRFARAALGEVKEK